MDQNNKKKKNFHRHFATPGLNLYWIIIAYIIIGWFYPVIGLIALICMIGPVLTSIWRGRFWCGNVCPRGNLYDRLLPKSRYLSLYVLLVSDCSWCFSSSACSVPN